MTANFDWPAHILTLAEWDALDLDERFRYELVEGVLFLMVRPRIRHQHADTTMTFRTNEQLPDHLIALQEVEVIITRTPLTIRIPDVVVTRRAILETDPQQIDAAAVRAVVEILSDGTRKVDRILKFAEYAEVGIPRYWILDIEGPVTLSSYVLVDGTYEHAGEFTGTTTVDVDGHPVRLDLDALIR